MHTFITNVFFVIPLIFFPVALGHNVISSRNNHAIFWRNAYHPVNFLTASVACYLYSFHTPINIRHMVFVFLFPVADSYITNLIPVSQVKYCISFNYFFCFIISKHHFIRCPFQYNELIILYSIFFYIFLNFWTT